jgi:hypothetical protein
MRLLLKAAFALAILLAAFIAAFFLLPAIGSPGPKALSYSVTRKVGGDLTFSTPCHRRADGLSDCLVTLSASGDGALYRVELHGRCWKARRIQGGGQRLARRATGCIQWRDQLRLMDSS